MTIEEEVQALLVANAGVTAIVATDKIKPPGDWQDLARPYIVHFPVIPATKGAFIQYMHSGRVPMTEWTYQISCFSDTYSEARALSQAVRAALEGVHNGCAFFWEAQTYTWEQSVRVHQIAVDFDVHEAL